MFFFEKKNQKTFIPLPRGGTKRMKSLFASFSSEKEESCFLPAPGAADPRLR
jgi:hypothetical protein